MTQILLACSTACQPQHHTNPEKTKPMPDEWIRIVQEPFQLLITCFSLGKISFCSTTGKKIKYVFFVLYSENKNTSRELFPLLSSTYVSLKGKQKEEYFLPLRVCNLDRFITSDVYQLADIYFILDFKPKLKE